MGALAQSVNYAFSCEKKNFFFKSKKINIKYKKNNFILIFSKLKKNKKIKIRSLKNSSSIIRK